MSERLLDVNAYTTLEFVEVVARGHDWKDEGAGVLDVQVPDTDDGAGDTTDHRILLELELDGTSLDHVVPHADRVELTSEQAQTLAAALVSATREDSTDRGEDRAR